MGHLAVALAVGLTALVQIFTDPRITPGFIWKSLLALALYALHGGIGLFVLLVLLPRNPDAAVGATVAMTSWILLGMLGLIRFAPRTQEPPRWLMHFGVPDVGLLLAIAWGVADVAGLV